MQPATALSGSAPEYNRPWEPTPASPKVEDMPACEDAATDLMADATPLPRGVDGDAGGGGEPQYAHRGMLCAAEGLLLDLERCAVFEAPCPGPDPNL